jgi:hypothetical protein
VEHIDIGNQLADILTKSLGHDRFIELWTTLGLVKISGEHQA